MSYYDSVTGLPSWTLFIDRADQALNLARRQGNKVALLRVNVMGLDRQLDEPEGSRLLLAVVQRLQEQLRAVDSITHFDRECFLVLLNAVASRSAAEAVAAELAQGLQRPLGEEPDAPRFDATVVTAVFPEDGTHSAALLDRITRAA
jgi:GGDEF domain-containing protein